MYKLIRKNETTSDNKYEKPIIEIVCNDEVIFTCDAYYSIEAVIFLLGILEGLQKGVKNGKDFNTKRD